MGWANASLRMPEELPRLAADTKGRGVVCEAPLDEGLHPSDCLPLSPCKRDESSSAAVTSARNSKGGTHSCLLTCGPGELCQYGLMCSLVVLASVWLSLLMYTYPAMMPCPEKSGPVACPC